MSTTARYPFEHHLHAWARRWVQGLCGRTCGVFIGLREDGSVRRVYLAHPERELSGEEKQALVSRYNHWFLYHPYEDGGAYLEWFSLSQRWPETWLQRALEADDFLDGDSGGRREGWPESWRVIVA